MDENPSRFKGNSNHPVDCVSWYDVEEFLHKLNAREGGGDYRLPTEAQWEYACSAGTEPPRYHHDVDAIAWYDANSNDQTHPVGQKVPNAWGLYDMLGNVDEWGLDGKREYTADTAVDPMGPTDTGAVRVIRGGGWVLPARFVRAVYRDWLDPGLRYPDTGFRCLSSGREPVSGA